MAAQNAGDPDAALLYLGRRDAAYPRGSFGFGEYGVGMRVFALRATGRKAETSNGKIDGS